MGSRHTTIEFDFDRSPLSASTYEGERRTSYGIESLEVLADALRDVGLEVEIRRGSVWNTASMTIRTDKGETMASYDHKDVLQALTAAILFHEDIALAARDEEGGQLHPGAGNTVLLSDAAADLLREAWEFIEGHDNGDALREDKGHGYSRYDLRKEF